jgi:G3E family GTPase
MDERIPVTIITGFLGSGKTTLLNRLLQHPALADTAVIINEFGEIGLDHLLVATPAENMVLLKSGCLCCTIRGDLVETLADLHAKRQSGKVPRFAGVVVETTGLADPVPIMQTVVTDEQMAACYRLHGVVTLVDGVHGTEQFDRNAESVKQAAVADALLVSKPDLAGVARVNALRERLARINPGADVHEALRGDVDPAFLFRDTPYDAGSKSPDVERWLKEEAFARAGESHAHRHHHRDVNRHDDRIRAFCLYYDLPITRAGLAMWLTTLAGLRGANLLRLKGLLNVEGEPVVVQAVQTIVHESVTLPAWPGSERRSRIVFITRDMERAELERTFDAFTLQRAPTGPGLDPRAYADFLQAMRGFR